MAQAADDPSACRVLDLPPAAAAVATSIPAAAAASKMVATCTAASPVSTTRVCHDPRPCHSLSVLPRSRQPRLSLPAEAQAVISSFSYSEHSNSLPFLLFSFDFYYQVKGVNLKVFEGSFLSSAFLCPSQGDD